MVVTFTITIRGFEVATANSTNKHQKYKSVELGDQLPPPAFVKIEQNVDSEGQPFAVYPSTKWVNCTEC